VRRSTSDGSTLHTGGRATVGRAGRFASQEPAGYRTCLGAAFFVTVVRLCAVGFFVVLRAGALRAVAFATPFFVVLRAGALRAVAFATPFFVVLRAGALRAVAFVFFVVVDGRAEIAPLALLDVLALPVVLRGLVFARPRTVRVPGAGTKTDWSPVAH
jgi:hypothetical protein